MSDVVRDVARLGVEYQIDYTENTDPESGRLPAYRRFPGRYMGYVHFKNYEETPRCACCHYKTKDGAYQFLNPIHGCLVSFCSLCYCRVVSARVMNAHPNELADEFWKFVPTEEKVDYLKYFSGAFVDALRWLDVEPDLADEIERRLVKTDHNLSPKH